MWRRNQRSTTNVMLLGEGDWEEVFKKEKAKNNIKQSQPNKMTVIILLVLWFGIMYYSFRFFNKPHEENFKLRQIKERFPQIFDPKYPPFGFGLSPKDQLLYDDTSFSCRNGLEKFPLSYFNDDYCDCKDGSDEPGTHACSSIISSKFYCSGDKKRIYSSFVNDGFCGKFIFKSIL